MTQVEFDVACDEAYAKFRALRDVAANDFEEAKRKIEVEWPLPCRERHHGMLRAKAVFNHQLDAAWKPYARAVSDLGRLLGSSRPEPG